MRKSRLLVMILAVLVLFLLAIPAQAKSLFYAANPSSIAVSSGATLNTGVALVTGQSNVQSVTVSGADSTALDYVLIYDAASATGTPKLDISIGTAGETVTITLNDASFGTGVFADANSDNMHISVEYTQ